MTKKPTYNTSSARYKLVFVCLLGIFIPGSVFAQDFQIEPPTPISKIKPDTDIHWHGLYFDPYVTVGSSVPFSSGTYSGGLGMNFGAELCYMFSKNFGFSAGIQYGQYSFTYQADNVSSSINYFEVPTAHRSVSTDTTVIAGYSSSVTYNLGYIGIPLQIRYLSNNNNRVGFFMEAGITANILVSKSASGSVAAAQYTLTQDPGTDYYTYSSASAATISVSESNPDVSVFNMAINLGIGIIIPVSKKVYIVGEYTPQIGLLNLGTGKNDVISFGSSQYYFYGNGNYGSMDVEAAALKVVVKL